MTRRAKTAAILDKIGTLSQSVDLGKLGAEIVHGFGGEQGLGRETVSEYFATEPGQPHRARLLELVFKILEKQGEGDSEILRGTDREDLEAALRTATESMFREEEDGIPAASADPGEGDAEADTGPATDD